MMILLHILLAIYLGVILIANLPLVREGTKAGARELDIKVYILVPLWPVYLAGCLIALVLLLNLGLLMLLGTLVLYGYQALLVLSGKEPDWTPIWEKKD